jgi:hypothetical protein
MLKQHETTKTYFMECLPKIRRGSSAATMGIEAMKKSTLSYGGV